MNPHPWPILQQAQAEEILEPIDLFLAGELLSKPTCDNQAQAALICHLSLAARSGHLCIHLAPQLKPDPEELWPHFPAIKELLNQALAQPIPQHPALILFQNSLYLQKFWQIEQNLIKQFFLHEGLPPQLPIDTKKI